MPNTTVGLLGIYLNDHLAGATGGLELTRRAAASHPALKPFVSELREDREALLDMMAALEVPVRRYKVYAAWAAEKAGRLKFNGRVVRRSPLSELLELEMLRLGVEGKIAGWLTLRELAVHDDRLDAGRLDELIAGARRQSSTLEKLRLRTVAELAKGSG
ncbi:hypothetical protein [Spirillospora sp. CA-294931]|uniref:hypothetical protein n=1 Tax=Spirillospora sp. CA-294931 TaxID=3240042 RepID=UPI003D921EEC